MPRTLGAERYDEYTTRSQNARNPESTSQGKVAQKRYSGMDQRGHRAALGHGCTTGHQKRMPVAKKVACSITCNQGSRKARSKIAGTCQAINTEMAADQPIAGLLTKRPSHFMKRQRRNGPTISRATDCGIPCSDGKAGAPSKTSGGAMAMSRR